MNESLLAFNETLITALISWMKEMIHCVCTNQYLPKAQNLDILQEYIT